MGTHPIFESDFDCLTDMINEPDSRLLQTGLEVSAKFKGAFCEARIKGVDAEFRLKLRMEDGKVIQTSDRNVSGEARLGAKVEYKGRKGVVLKLKDVSVYTVVFDDMDEKTMKRSSLRIKGTRHFDESVTLDSLPLNDPEHFGDKVTSNELMSSMIPSSSFMEDDESIQSPMDKEAREEDSEYSAESHSEKNDQPTVNEPVSPLPWSKLTLEQNGSTEERINLLEMHLCFLANQHHAIKAEISKIDRKQTKKTARGRKRNRSSHSQ